MQEKTADKKIPGLLYLREHMVTMIIIYYLILLQPKMYLATFEHRRKYCILTQRSSKAWKSQTLQQSAVVEMVLRTLKEISTHTICSPSPSFNQDQGLKDLLNSHYNFAQ